MVDPKFWLLLIPAIIQTIYTVLMYYKSTPATVSGIIIKPAFSAIVMLVLTIATWGAVWFDYYDRHFQSQLSLSLVQSWGVNPPATPYMIINTNSLKGEKTSAKVMLILRVQYANIDRMTDHAIEKSGLYTITGGIITLAHDELCKLRIMPQTQVALEFNLALVQNNFSADNIVSLSDVARIGGKILATTSSAATFDIAPLKKGSDPIK